MKPAPLLEVTLKHGWCVLYSPDSNPVKAVRPASPGPFPQDYFPRMTIESVTPDAIVVSSGYGERKTLTPGQEITFLNGESREFADGSTIGDEYLCRIEWPEVEPPSGIKIVIETTADRNHSVDTAWVGLLSVPVGRTFNLSLNFPPQYHPYIRPILVTILPDRHKVKLLSEYGAKTLSWPEDPSLTTPVIGLSYATCIVRLTLC